VKAPIWFLRDELLQIELALLDLARLSDVRRYRTAAADARLRYGAHELEHALRAAKAAEVAHALDVAEAQQARAVAVLAVLT
jgi:hypothetical protein